MTEETWKFEAILNGYAKMAADLRTDWTTYLDALTEKTTSASFGPQEAAAEFPAFAQAAYLSMFRIFGEAGDTISTLLADFDQHEKVPFINDPLAGKKVTTEVTLSPKGDWKSETKQVIPVDRVTVDPPQLVPPNFECTLLVDETGLEPGIYNGYVVSTDSNGTVIGETYVPVTIA